MTIGAKFSLNPNKTFISEIATFFGEPWVIEANASRKVIPNVIIIPVYSIKVVLLAHF